MALNRKLRSLFSRSDVGRGHDPYFVQRVQLSSALVGQSRLAVFSRLCAGRDVLHVGCADWPITDPSANLHVQLDRVCRRLDGIDMHADALEVLRPHVKGKLTSCWGDLSGCYDVLLVPEVMEHVGNLEDFFQQLDAVDAASVVITVPDAYQCASRHFQHNQATSEFVEIVHPDHNCWYTPYTLANVVRKYTDWRLDGIWLFNRISLLALMTRNPEKRDLALSPV